ncbi:MAG: hypothetical protein WCA99_02820, partial [Candidatus Sulfotelmatobacter sp.]
VVVVVVVEDGVRSGETTDWDATSCPYAAPARIDPAKKPVAQMLDQNRPVIPSPMISPFIEFDAAIGCRKCQQGGHFISKNLPRHDKQSAKICISTQLIYRR